MDPYAEKTPGLALPKPAQEHGGFNTMPQPAAQPEAVLPSMEANLAPMVPSVVVPQGAVPMQPVNQGVPTQPPIVATQVTQPTTDENTDALDEEWINKAKAIVEQTKHDPHLESQELGRVKADYMRIRYNKQLKVAEDNK